MNSNYYMFVSDEFLVYIHIQHSYNTQHLKRKVYCKQCKVSFAAVVAGLYDPLGSRSDYADFSSQIVTKYYFYFLVILKGACSLNVVKFYWYFCTGCGPIKRKC